VRRPSDRCPASLGVRRDSRGLRNRHGQSASYGQRGFPGYTAAAPSSGCHAEAGAWMDDGAFRRIAAAAPAPREQARRPPRRAGAPKQPQHPPMSRPRPDARPLRPCRYRPRPPRRRRFRAACSRAALARLMRARRAVAGRTTAACATGRAGQAAAVAPLDRPRPNGSSRPLPCSTFPVIVTMRRHAAGAPQWRTSPPEDLSRAAEDRSGGPCLTAGGHARARHSRQGVGWPGDAVP
jgi:hypothetical protein